MSHFSGLVVLTVYVIALSIKTKVRLDSEFHLEVGATEFHLEVGAAIV